MSADFGGAESKVTRAEVHVHSFLGELRTWLDRKPLTSRVELSGDGTTAEVYVVIKEPIPEALPLMMGDRIHNLRSALDHVATALAIANGGSGDDRNVQFPICDTFEKFHGYPQGQSAPATVPKAAAVNRLASLSQPARDYIVSVQPFADRAKFWPLEEVQYLDNRDKHRSLLMHYVEAVALLADPPGVTTKYEARLRFVDGAHVCTVSYAPTYTGPKGHVGLPVALAVDRSNGVGWLDAAGFLEKEAVGAVRAVVDEARRQFS